uniref:Uncharacterized protein n=1 Tax=Anguilla anguilla TaxID=7936 RepID=A0A0E9UXB7_ANGAN
MQVVMDLFPKLSFETEVMHFGCCAYFAAAGGGIIQFLCTLYCLAFFNASGLWASLVSYSFWLAVWLLDVRLSSGVVAKHNFPSCLQ